MPYPEMTRAYRLMTATSEEIDRPLLERLAARGFRLDDGMMVRLPDALSAARRRLLLQCRRLRPDRRWQVGLVQYGDVDASSPNGLKLKDGSVCRPSCWCWRPATRTSRRWCVPRSATSSPIASARSGVRRGRRARNMWRPTPQRVLVHRGQPGPCRIYSRYLALQIKAREEGILSGQALVIPAAAGQASPTKR